MDYSKKNPIKHEKQKKGKEQGKTYTFDFLFWHLETGETQRKYDL